MQALAVTTGTETYQQRVPAGTPDKQFELSKFLSCAPAGARIVVVGSPVVTLHFTTGYPLVAPQVLQALSNDI